jgi:predicted DNA-binding transcriptional regulator AlpA
VCARTEKYLPERQVCKRYGVTDMTLWRWDHDLNLNFPKPTYIRGRKYRNERELDAFDQAQREASHEMAS